MTRAMESAARIAAAAMVAASLSAAAVMPGEAHAASLAASAPATSLPYVEDVNPCGSGYTATVSCCGVKAELRATAKGKAVKCRRIGACRWELKLKAGVRYKLSVKARGGAWKSIEYRVCR